MITKGVLKAEISVPWAAVVPPVISPPALDVPVFDDERRIAQRAALRSAVAQIWAAVEHQMPPSPGKRQVLMLLMRTSSSLRTPRCTSVVGAFSFNPPNGHLPY
jgi:hypothetical protein